MATLLGALLVHSGCNRSEPPPAPPVSSKAPTPAPAPAPTPAPAKPAAAEHSKVEIKDGHFFVDGERFIVRGIGYDPGSHPGQTPKFRVFQPELMANDLRRIHEAGFNTVRCWDGYSDEELALIEKEGLWVIQGIEIDWRQDYSKRENLRQAMEHIDRVVKAGAKHKNILMYLVMNEPMTEAILKTGEPQFVQLLQTLRDHVREMHPGVAVSFSNTCVGEFLDPSPWDAIAFNLYMYGPVTVKNVLGYRGYLSWLKRRIPPSVPLVVTEFGLSVSPAGEGRFGYGGNSPQDQVDGDLWMLQNLLEAGAEGSCVFSYSDGWWKNGDKPNDAETHEDEPEEWYGLVGYDSKADTSGTPRPAFDAMRRANQATWIQPVSWQEYRENIPVEVYATDEVEQITAVVSDPDKPDVLSDLELPLTREGHWWRGNLPASGPGAIKTITLIARSKTAEISRQQRTVVTDWSQTPPEMRPLEFTLETIPDPLPSTGAIPVTFRVRSPLGGKVADRVFKVGRYPHDGWAPGETFDARSDADGLVRANMDAVPGAVITLSISTGHEALQKGPTWGDAFIFRIPSAK